MRIMDTNARKVCLRTFVIGLAAIMVGCNAVGPRALVSARPNYNQAIARTWNEQLLLNLVRLKYRDTLVFLEVTSVSSQYTATYSAGASSSFIGNGASDTLGLDAGVSFSERPTIIYSPLQGQDFVTQLLSPIPLKGLVLLSQSGWSMQRVLSLCAQRINGLDNASSASGPTPQDAPEFQDYQRVGKILREMQKRGEITAFAGGGSDGQTFTFQISEAAEDTPSASELRTLLGLNPDVSTLPVTDGWSQRVSPTTLAMQTRSLLGVFHFLSNAVESPKSHADAGWVVTTRDAEGEEFDWTEVTGNLMRIQYQQNKPGSAFVTIPYRGGWFYIDDSDLNSKATFGLLTYLFYLQAGDIKSFAPTLTLPLG